MDTRKGIRFAIFSSLALGLTSIQGCAGGGGTAKAESPCAKQGPFSPRVDKDLLREDLVIEPAVSPRARETRNLTPEQERDAERGACQDPQTGNTIHMPEPPRSGKRDDPGGDEGDPSLPRGDERDLPRGNKREAAAPPFFLKTFVFAGGRVLQSPTTSFPFRAVVKLLIKFPTTPSGTATGCTGSLIGDKHVLTAG